MSFLTRVFADVDFTSEESVWKSGVEAHIEALKSKVTEAAEAAAAAASKQTEAAAAEADESSKSSEEIERLEKQVTHYKSSLQETVSSRPSGIFFYFTYHHSTMILKFFLSFHRNKDTVR